jgi:hypothetical protein
MTSFACVTVTLALSGCWEVPSEGTDAEEVDEETQAWNSAFDTLRDYCDDVDQSRRRYRPTDPPSSAEQRRAERALERIFLIARRYEDSGYETQHEYRSFLVATANEFEDRDCLPERVAEIDRFLRRLTLPEPPAEEETESEY